MIYFVRCVLVEQRRSAQSKIHCAHVCDGNAQFSLHINKQTEIIELHEVWNDHFIEFYEDNAWSMEHFIFSFSLVRFFFFFLLFVLDLAIVCNSVVAKLQCVTLTVVYIRRFFLKMSNIATLKKIAQCLNLLCLIHILTLAYKLRVRTRCKLKNYCNSNYWPKFECFA